MVSNAFSTIDFVVATYLGMPKGDMPITIKLHASATIMLGGMAIVADQLEQVTRQEAMEFIGRMSRFKEVIADVLYGPFSGVAGYLDLALDTIMVFAHDF